MPCLRWPDVEAELDQSRGEQRQLALVGVVHGDEHVAAGRQAAFVCGELALGERVREVAVEAHDLAGGTHFRSEQHVDGLAERSAESLERKHGFLDGHLLATMDVATVAVGQEQAVVTLLLDGFADHDAGGGLGQCHTGGLGSERHGTGGTRIGLDDVQSVGHEGILHVDQALHATALGNA